jgi:hypothetical protein
LEDAVGALIGDAVEWSRRTRRVEGDLEPSRRVVRDQRVE